MKKIVVLSGAGISAESGIGTFRDNGGLWDKYEISEVATPEAWAKNPQLVQEFYNERRKQCGQALPNAAHRVLVELEKKFEVQIVTQNVDDLHERAGSKKVLHLHGELTKVRSTINESLVYDQGYQPLNMGDVCELGAQLRPHIVWFGEMVPLLEQAAEIVAGADVLMIVGTSLNVYPAASLYEYAPEDCPIYVIDPKEVAVQYSRFKFVKEKASTGLEKVARQLMNGI